MASIDAVVSWFDGKESKFLTVGGGLSPEYPDAEKFPSIMSAARAADRLRKRFPGAKKIDIIVNYGTDNEGTVYAI